MKKVFSILFLLIFSPYTYSERLKYALENFELSGLEIISTGYHANTGWLAQIADKNNDIHFLPIGGFIGRNAGKVTKIEQGKIYIKEIIQNDMGNWIEREVVFRQ